MIHVGGQLEEHGERRQPAPSDSNMSHNSSEQDSDDVAEEQHMERMRS